MLDIAVVKEMNRAIAINPETSDLQFTMIDIFSYVLTLKRTSDSAWMGSFFWGDITQKQKQLESLGQPFDYCSAAIAVALEASSHDIF